MIYRFINENFTLVRVDFGPPVFNLPSPREDSVHTLGSLSSAGGKTNYFEYQYSIWDILCESNSVIVLTNAIT